MSPSICISVLLILELSKMKDGDIRQKTELYQAKVKEAQIAASEIEALAGDGDHGQKLFQSCAGCHAKDTRLVGPPLT